MDLILSYCSPTAHFVCWDPQNSKVEEHLKWKTLNSAASKDLLEENFQKILKTTQRKSSDFDKFYCVSGPGSFTALRSSAAFMKGLSLSLNKKLYGISTADLLGSGAYIPLRAQKSVAISLQKNIEEELPFLKISSECSHQYTILDSKINPKCIWGTLEQSSWPSLEQITNLLKNESFQSKEFKMDYGYEPEFVKSFQAP